MARTVRFGILSTFTPTACGLASFSSSLAAALSAGGSEVGVVRIADGSPSSDGRVIGELVKGSSASADACIAALNQREVVVVQHDHDLYGGTHGDELLTILGGLRVPTMVVVHSVLKDPAPHQRWVLEQIASLADRVVVMSEVARERLSGEYAVDLRKIVRIPHGASLPTQPRLKRASRPLILTCGFLGPGKGVERVIDVMPSLTSVGGRPRYLVAGQTRPGVLVREGEAYRQERIEQARRLGVADSVSFDDRYIDRVSLTALIQSAAVIVLPYDSTDQVTSGVLVDAVAGGRPVVATAFPHAVELLRGGAGIIVPHDDPDALAAGLRRVLTQPRLAGTMAAEARQLASAMAWPVVANAYVQEAARLLQEKRTGD
ncbi:glycosyltransferase [Mycolicibacterium iranicum]|uniref:Glycosyltransferase n=1 Tax=Mycolicibacterium iranicum TaxID=912594 RepID=A0ABT4HAQ7_MYCIR|nr:glycosyltransferase [Mycolicibacterium iranicum]MCZ0727283.1 glycosyltransferase [Mycolicibacterium iranicum]